MISRATNRLPVRSEEQRLISDERRQLHAILTELRKEIPRMDADDWKYPSFEKLNK